jgi:uncharacterized membrane protein
MPDLATTTEPLDTRIEKHIGVLLKIGILTSGIVIALGGAMFLLIHGTSTADYHAFRGEPESLRTVTGIVKGAFHGHSLSIMQLGMLLLIATPVARVVFSVIAFLRMKDYQYVLISGIVLVVLTYSLIWH